MKRSYEDWVSLMADMSKTVPVDLNWIELTQMMAEFLESAALSDEQQAVLSGMGAKMYQQGLMEFRANGRASILLERLQRKL